MPKSSLRLLSLRFCVESCICLISLFSVVCAHVNNYLEDYDATTNRFNDVLKIGQNGSETHGLIWPTRMYNYRPNMNCSVKLEVVAGHNIFLTFTDFYLPCEQGYLKVSGQENTITCCYPGPNDNCNMQQLKSASNWLKVLFVIYNSSVFDTHNGFQIYYEEYSTVPAGGVALIVSITILAALILAVIVFFIHEYIKKHKTKRQQRRPAPETAARELSTVHYTPPSHNSSTATGSGDVVEFGGAFPSPPMYDQIIIDQPPPAYSQCVEVSDK